MEWRCFELLKACKAVTVGEVGHFGRCEKLVEGFWRRDMRSGVEEDPALVFDVADMFNGCPCSFFVMPSPYLEMPLVRGELTCCACVLIWAFFNPCSPYESSERVSA